MFYFKVLIVLGSLLIQGLLFGETEGWTDDYKDKLDKADPTPSGVLNPQSKLMGKGIMVLEDFFDSQPGAFPKRWVAKNPHDGAERYKVIKAGDDLYLSIDAVKDGTPIFRKIDWDIRKHPILEWCWRARSLPVEGNERHKSKNDSAAAVYVVFPVRLFLPDSLKYLWSTEAKLNEEFSNTLGRNKMFVVQSGDMNLGKWVVERRNAKEDYKQRFKKSRARRQPVALGIITDGDQTQSLSAGDYKYFRVMTEEAAKRNPLQNSAKSTLSSTLDCNASGSAVTH